MTEKYTLEECITMLVSLQCNMSISMLPLIFPKDSDHYVQKWIQSRENLLLFYNSLDGHNQIKLLNYIT